MKIGTRSVLYGAHCFFIHPWFVARSWWILYGFPLDPRLWLAFFVHDIGYIGKPNMDGPEGETHVELGANIMERLFGKKWGNFCRYHSRFYAKRDNQPFSRLCVADKLAIALTPRWIYEPMTRFSGEWAEYEAIHADPTSKYRDEERFGGQDWYDQMVVFVLKWVDEHKDGREDTWTKHSA